MSIRITAGLCIEPASPDDALSSCLVMRNWSWLFFRVSLTDLACVVADLQCLFDCAVSTKPCGCIPSRRSTTMVTHLYLLWFWYASSRRSSQLKLSMILSPSWSSVKCMLYSIFDSPDFARTCSGDDREATKCKVKILSKSAFLLVDSEREIGWCCATQEVVTFWSPPWKE